MTFKKLTEEVTKSKYNKYKSIIDSNEDIYNEFCDLDFRDDLAVNEFVSNRFGEPKGIWKNTKEEQMKLLRRLKTDTDKGTGVKIYKNYTEM